MSDETEVGRSAFDVEKLLSEGFMLETRVEDGRVVMTINGQEQARMTPSEAKAVAREIDDVVMGKTASNVVDVLAILRRLRLKVVR